MQSLILLIAAFAAFVSAQFPACAAGVIIPLIAQTNCGDTDAACLCSSPQWLSDAPPAISSACDPSDASSALAAGSSLCSAATAGNDVASAPPAAPTTPAAAVPTPTPSTAALAPAAAPSSTTTIISVVTSTFVTTSTIMTSAPSLMGDPDVVAVSTQTNVCLSTIYSTIGNASATGLPTSPLITGGAGVSSSFALGTWSLAVLLSALLLGL